MVNKFEKIIAEIESQQGDFTLFAIIKMDNFTDKWSVITSAKWINEDNKEKSFNIIASVIRKNLNEAENSSIGRIGIFPTDDHITKLFLKYKAGIPLKNEKVNGFNIHEAYILRSKTGEQ